MAHYALLDENNTVINVITGRNENDIVDGISDWENFYQQETGFICKRTSYNSNIRKNYAGIGFTYDPIEDIFIPPKPYKSWILNKDTHNWLPPIERPLDNSLSVWNEKTLSWIDMPTKMV